METKWLTLFVEVLLQSRFLQRGSHNIIGAVLLLVFTVVLDLVILAIDVIIVTVVGFKDLHGGQLLSII